MSLKVKKIPNPPSESLSWCVKCECGQVRTLEEGGSFGL